MNRRVFWCGLTVLLGFAMLTLVCWLGLSATASADPTLRYVATSGSDAANDCTAAGSPCQTVQHAIDQANDYDEVLVAGGTYGQGGTVAAIDKPITVRGGYGPGFGFDPDMYETTLDAGWGGSVVSMTGVAEVRLEHLAITHGDGSDNLGFGTGAGGGIYAVDVELFVGWCTIADNVGSSTGEGWGGGVYVGNDTHDRSLTILHSAIVSNTASISATASGDGGGLYVFYGGLELEESELSDNLGHAAGSSMAFGGGAYLVGLSHARVQSSTIENNTARGSGSGPGGGMYVVSSSDVQFINNRIAGNWGSLQGGGLSLAWSDVHLTRNQIVSNTSGAGGGVYLRSLTPVTISNNLIVRNTTTSRGGGVYVVHGDPQPSYAYLFNNTIADNTTDGLATWGYAVVTMTNNLVSGNPIGIYLAHPASATIAADTNLFWNTSDPVTGTNSIQQAPNMWGDYRLREGSPAVDAGLNIAGLTTDIEGNPRPWDGYDLGAYEGVWWEVFLPLVLREL